MAMTNPIQPVLHSVRIAELRPTQMTVGLREVEHKRTQWLARRAESGGEYLGRHLIPAVIGPTRSTGSSTTTISSGRSTRPGSRTCW